MKLVQSLILILFMTNFLVAEKPEPLDNFRFNFPEYEIKESQGGSDVIYVKDDSQSLISFRILVFGGNSVNPKAGVSEMTASMLTKGTKNFDASEIASKLDGLGAKFSVSSTDDYISINITILNRNLNQALPVIKEILNNPEFDNSELKKLKMQTKAYISTEKSNPDDLASKLAKKIVFGKNHPYSSFPSESDIDEIDTDDLESFYKRYFHQRNISIAIFGNYDKEVSNSILDLVSTLPSEKETKPQISISATKPLPKGIYFIERPGSVQSTVRLVYPGLARKDTDYEKLSFLSSVVGAGFTGRLFKTLREKYSYTYTPFAYLTNNKYYNYLIAGADVNTAVTDSAIDVTLEQIDDLSQNNLSNQELSSISKNKIGNFQMSFEKSSFIASLLQNALYIGLTAEQMENYTDRLERLNTTQLKIVASQHLKNSDAYLIVVGSAEVKKILSKYGKIYDYDTDIKPASNYKKIDLNAKELIAKYVDAIGGKKAIKKITKLTVRGSVNTIMGGKSSQSELLEVRDNGKLYQSLGATGATQEKWFDGSNAWIAAAGMKQEIPINQNLKLEAMLFNITSLFDLDYDCKVLGLKNGMVYLEAKAEDGAITKYRFDENSFLLLGSETSADTPQGVMEIDNTYSNYITIENVKFPRKATNKNHFFTMEATLSYEIGSIPNGIKFKPE